MSNCHNCNDTGKYETEKFNIFIEEKYQLSKKTKILDVEKDEIE